MRGWPGREPVLTAVASSAGWHLGQQWAELPGLTAATSRLCCQDVGFGFCFCFDLYYWYGLLRAQGRGSACARARARAREWD